MIEIGRYSSRLCRAMQIQYKKWSYNAAFARGQKNISWIVWEICHMMRLEASKIHHLPQEKELVQTFIRSLDGICYKILFCTSMQNFDSLIWIGKEVEYDIQRERIVDE